MSLLLLACLALLFGVHRLTCRFVGSKLPNHIEPTAWLLTPWLIGIALFALPIIVHREKMELQHVVYIFGCLTAFWIGSLAHMLATSKQTHRVPNEVINLSNFMLPMALLGFVGYMAKAADQIMLSGISLQERLTSTAALGAARAMRNAISASEIQGRFHSLHILSVFSLIYLAAYFSGAERRGKSAVPKIVSYKLLAVATLIVIAMNSLVIEAGRVDLVITMLVILSIFLLDSERSLISRFRGLGIKTKVFVVVGIPLFGLTLVTLAIYFLKARIGATAPELLMSLTHRATIHPLMVELFGKSDIVDAALLQLSYATTAISTLCYYLSLPENQFPGPFFGIANFPGVFDRLIYKIDRTAYAGSDWFAIANFPLVLQGYAANVWSTLLRDLALDVTRAGVPVVLFGFGIVSRWVVCRAYFQKNPVFIMFAAVMLTMLAFSAFHTISNRDLIFGAVRMAVFLIVLNWFLGLFRVIPRVALKRDHSDFQPAAPAHAFPNRTGASR